MDIYVNGIVVIRALVRDPYSDSPVSDVTVYGALQRVTDNKFFTSGSSWATFATWTALKAGAGKQTLVADGFGGFSFPVDLSVADPNMTGEYLCWAWVETGAFACSPAFDLVQVQAPPQSGIVAASSAATTVIDCQALTWVRASEQVLNFTCTDLAGNIVDITGHNIAFTIKPVPMDDDADDSEATFTATASIISGPAGTCMVTIPQADSAELETKKTYWWDLTDLDLGHNPYARGTLTVLPNVTNRTS